MIKISHQYAWQVTLTYTSHIYTIAILIKNKTVINSRTILLNSKDYSKNSNILLYYHYSDITLGISEAVNNYKYD
jgi:hypothetical protein